MPNLQPPFQSLINIALKAVSQIREPLLLYGVVQGVLVLIVLLLAPDVPPGLSPIVYSFTLFPLIVAVGHFFLQVGKERGEATTYPREAFGATTRRSFPVSDSDEFVGHVRELMLKAHRIVLVGTGLNVLHRDPLREEVMNRAKDGHCQLEIYLADPHSRSVQVRLLEEELGKQKPPVAYEGLKKRLQTLCNTFRTLDSPNSIHLALFSHYPTFALLIVDSAYFIYPYAYKQLGNFSPVLAFDANEPSDTKVVAFLDGHYRRVKEDSSDVQRVFSIREGKGEDTSSLHAFALYFVPSQETHLYRYGTSVLGYDIRKGEVQATTWQNEVGIASTYGLHLTLCDVLFFQNKSGIENALAEIEFLAAQFSPFPITNLRLKSRFPNERALSIVGDSQCGKLEALHHELVGRVNTRACCSNYSLGTVSFDRHDNPSRTRLMTERYLAPYILNHFQPHFTLLQNLSPANQDRRHQQLQELFNESVSPHEVHVDTLSVMGWSSERNHWAIEKEIRLG